MSRFAFMIRTRGLVFLGPILLAVVFSGISLIRYFVDAHQSQLHEPAPKADERAHRDRSKHREALIMAIIEAGGSVHYDWEFDEELNFISIPSVPSVRELAEQQTRLGADGNGRVYEVRFPINGTDALLKQLSVFRELRILSLAYCSKITDDGVSVVAKLSELRTLWLYRNNPNPHIPSKENEEESLKRITDKSLEHVARLKKVKELLLYDNGFTNAGLDKLKTATPLRRLGISDSSFSTQKVDELRHALPLCSIIGGSVQ